MIAEISIESNFSLDNTLSSGLGSLNMIEQSMNSFIVELENNPAVSPAETLVMQAQIQTWATMIDMYSSIVKTYSETAKQVTNNMAQ